MSDLFHLFRAPGEPGYIEGAMTGAGQFAPSDTGNDAWDAACDAGAQEVIDRLGLTWLNSDALVGECGLLLPEDYLDQITAGMEDASERFCSAPVWHVRMTRDEPDTSSALANLYCGQSEITNDLNCTFDTWDREHSKRSWCPDCEAAIDAERQGRGGDEDEPDSLQHREPLPIR